MYQLSDPLLILSIYLLPECKRSFYFYVLDHLSHMGLQLYFLYQLGSMESGFTKNLREASDVPPNVKNTWMNEFLRGEM